LEEMEKVRNESVRRIEQKSDDGRKIERDEDWRDFVADVAPHRFDLDGRQRPWRSCLWSASFEETVAWEKKRNRPREGCAWGRAETDEYVGVLWQERIQFW
jgi:hypothetical protein